MPLEHEATPGHWSGAVRRTLTSRQRTESGSGRQLEGLEVRLLQTASVQEHRREGEPGGIDGSLHGRVGEHFCVRPGW